VIILIIIYQFPEFNDLSYGLKFAIRNSIIVFNFSLLYGAQFFLGHNFYKHVNKKAVLFHLNGILSLLFCIVACIWFIYHFPMYLKMIDMKPRDSPETVVRDTIVWIMIYHFLLNYFFINNQFIRKGIKMTTDSAIQLRLKSEFLKPMQRIVRLSTFLIIVIFIYFMINFMQNRKLKPRSMPAANIGLAKNGG